MNNITLEIIHKGKIIFQSDKHWLHPLFDLEKHLAQHPIDMTDCIVRDKIIGKAAALLIIRMGAGSVHGDVMSELGRNVLEKASVPYTYNKLVKRIDCQTEQILLEINDPDTAYQILRERIK